MSRPKKTEIRETFGKRLQRIRRVEKESQEILAKQLHIHFMSVSRWERGVSSPSLDQLVFISRHYHVPVEYLLGMDDDH